MADYSKIIIYKIQHNTNPELVYVGHTTNYVRRKWEHGNGIKNKPEYPLYKKIIEHGGWDAFCMSPIMKFPCETKIQAEIQEEKCRVELKATLNVNKAHEEDKTLKWKKYEELHKEERKQSKHDYYVNHKEQLLERSRKDYIENRKEEMAKKYQENKDVINAHRKEKYTCECGKTISRREKSSHEKSKFHMENKLK